MKTLAILCAATLGLLIGVAGANAQSQQPLGGGVVLPPALQAAVQSGNTDAVRQAIAVLSGGNATVANRLSGAVILQAQGFLESNPGRALAAIQGAMVSIDTNVGGQDALDAFTRAAQAVNSPQARQSNPQLADQLASQAAEGLISPAVYDVNPQAVIGALADVYATVGGGDTQTGQQVAVLIRQASTNAQLNSVNPSNQGQMLAILNKTQNAPPRQQERQLPPLQVEFKGRSPV